MRTSVKYDDGLVIRVWKSQTDPLDDVLFLMNQSKSLKVTEQWLANKLAWGRGGIATVAYNGDLPIGMVLFGAAPYFQSNRPVEVFLSLYNYVTSDYRRRGIYNRLLTVMDQALEAEFVEMAFTYPNLMARPGVRKNDWASLAPMQAYVHIPVTWRFGSMPARIRKFRDSRGADFTPVAGEGLNSEDLKLISDRSVESQALHFAQSPAALEYRFNFLRGPGYQAIHGESVSAVVRVGWRGSISEVQFMTTSPKRIASKDWRELVRLVKTSFGPDMISRIESGGNTASVAALTAGFMRLRSITIPFCKSFQKRSVLEAPNLTGIDLHLW